MGGEEPKPKGVLRTSGDTTILHTEYLMIVVICLGGKRVSDGEVDISFNKGIYNFNKTIVVVMWPFVLLGTLRSARVGISQHVD